MLNTKLWSPLLVVAGIAALPAWSDSSRAVILSPAQPGEVIIVERAPPPLRAEVIPAAREGYVWAPGYWNWDGTTYVWVDGRYLQDPSGAVYGERWQKDPNKPNPLGNATANPLQPSAGQ